MNTTDTTAERLFTEAAPLPPAERAALLDARCPPDSTLRAEVESLLAAHDRDGAFLDAPPLVLSGEDAPGTSIGPYRIVSRIGSGGMGVVYLAEQEHPIRRRVALKVLRAGIDTDRAIARFDAERHTLALMDHPNVARVLDSGVTKRARPYVAMEYVAGLSITDYCDRQAVPLRERLELFATVCLAVHHAHQKGVIHRDIKASNVLITEQAGTRIPKVIDFGVAKAVAPRTDGRTLLTERGELIGTPEYMSPEQAASGGQDIDIRTDVYSLGVLLYRLVTGVMPFDGETFRSAGLAEILRILRDVDPPRPSTRLLQTPRTPGRTDSGSARQVRGDLDWIAMKAMDKDRARRYASASDLAADIRRHLNNEPVLAGPPSAAYRLRKFVRRNRVTAVAAAAVLAAILAGLAGTTFMYLEAARQRDHARAALDRAETETATAKAINDFLNDDLLSAVDPAALGRTATVREALDRAAASIDGKFPDRPLVEAAVRATLANTYMNLGEYERAEPHARRAWELYRPEYGREGPALISSIVLGNICFRMGRYDESDRLAQLHLEVAEQYGPEHGGTLTALNNLAVIRLTAGRPADAEPIQRRVVEIGRRVWGPEHPSTLMATSSLGLICCQLGRYAEAEAIIAPIVEAQKRVVGPEHPDTFIVLRNLARAYAGLDRLTDAEKLLTETYAAQQRVLSESHPETITVGWDLAMVTARLGRLDEADALARRLMQIEDRNPADHAGGMFDARMKWAQLCRDASRFEHAEAVYLALLEPRPGAPSMDPARADRLTRAIANLYERWGRPDRAAEWSAKSTPAAPPAR